MASSDAASVHVSLPSRPEAAGAAADNCSETASKKRRVAQAGTDTADDIEAPSRYHTEEVAVRARLLSGVEVAALTLPPSCTVAELKAMVQHHIPERARPRLLHGDQVLEHGTQTLADVNIATGSTLTLLAHPEHLWASSTTNGEGKLSVDENDTYIFRKGRFEIPMIVAKKSSRHHRVRVLEHNAFMALAMQAGFVAAAPEDQPDLRGLHFLDDNRGQRWFVGSQLEKSGNSPIIAGNKPVSDGCIKVRPQGTWAHQFRSGCIVDLQLYSDEGKCFFKVSVDDIVKYLVEVEQQQGDVYPAVSLFGGTSKVELMDFVDGA